VKFQVDLSAGLILFPTKTHNYIKMVESFEENLPQPEKSLGIRGKSSREVPGIASMTTAIGFLDIWLNGSNIRKPRPVLIMSRLLHEFPMGSRFYEKSGWVLLKIEENFVRINIKRA